MGCRTRRPTPELVRVVGDGAGGIAPGARAPGRGAWLCPEVTCVEQAIRTRALTRSLRSEVRLSDADLGARLVEILRIGSFEPDAP